MKANTFVQYAGRELLVSDLEKRAREIWKEKGYLMKDLNSLELYIKVEEDKCYYVMNGTLTGDFSING